MSKWISVENGLPESDSNVEKYSDTHMEFCTVIAYGKTKGGFGKIVKETNRYVTHKTGNNYIDEITTLNEKDFDKWYWADG